MKIDKQKLIEDLQDTISNNFQEEVIDYLFDKYSYFVETDSWHGYDVINAEKFDEAMYEFLDMIINFIKSAKN